jgi:6-pyruvoyl-tetrahydropterin synthase related domain
MSSSKRPPDRTVWLLVALAGLSVLAVQFRTVPKVRDLVLSRSEGISLDSVQENALQFVVSGLAKTLDTVDLLLIASMALLFLVLIVLEAARDRLTLFFSRLGDSPAALYGFLLFLSVVATRYYLHPGDVFLADSESLGIRVWMVAEHLKAGQWPVWSNYWYGGYPLLHFYAPLYFVTVGLPTIAFGDIHLATKLVLWLTHVGSMFTMFLFLKEARNTHSAILGSLAYGVVFHRISIILYSGDVILCIIWLLYPLLFFATEGYLSRRLTVRASFLLIALSTAGIILTHHAYAFFGGVFMAVYVLVRVLAGDGDRMARIKALGFFALSAVAGFLIGAFSLLPFILEYDQVRGMPALPFSALLPFPPGPELFAQMLTWLPAGHPNTTMAYVGLSLFVFSLVSTVYAVKERAPIALALSVCFLVSLCTLRGGSNYNTKNMNFVIFFMAALMAYVPPAVRSLFPKRNRRWTEKRGAHCDAKIAVLSMGVVLLDLGPLTFQDTFVKGFYEFQDRMYEKVLALDPSYRVMDRRVVRYDPAQGLKGNFESNRLGVVSAYQPIHSPLGRLHEAAGLSISYHSELMKRVQLDLNQESLSEPALEGLYLMGVKFLLFRDRNHFFAPPLAPTADYSIHGDILELDRTRPLLMSSRLLPIQDIPGYPLENPIENDGYYDVDMIDYDMPYYETVVKPLLDKMNIDLERGTADCLIVREGTLPPNGSGESGEIEFEVKSFSVDIDTVEIRYAAEAPGYGRVPFSYFPYLDVRLDGREAPFVPSAMHAIVMSLPAGEHVITIQGRAALSRRITFPFSVVAFLVIVFLPPRALQPLAQTAPR